MKETYQRLITTCLLISSFIFLCGVDSCEQRYTVSGTVGGIIKDGVTVTMTGPWSYTVTATTSSDGNYSFTDIDTEGTTLTFTVTPSLSGYAFTPTSKSVTVPGDDLTSVDFTSAIATCDTVDRFLDNLDGTVTDCRTDLIWLKNADCYGNGQNLENATLSAAGLNSGECGLTEGSVEGDWRLPTKDELQGIGTDPPTTWESGFSSITWTMPSTPFTGLSELYWSSTEYFTDSVWYVHINDGGTYTALKDPDDPGGVEFPRAWPVRSGD